MKYTLIVYLLCAINVNVFINVFGQILDSIYIILFCVGWGVWAEVVGSKS